MVKKTQKIILLSGQLRWEMGILLLERKRPTERELSKVEMDLSAVKVQVSASACYFPRWVNCGIRGPYLFLSLVSSSATSASPETQSKELGILSYKGLHPLEFWQASGLEPLAGTPPSPFVWVQRQRTWEAGGRGRD